MTWQWKPNQRVVHYHYQVRKRYYRARSRHPTLFVVSCCLGIIAWLGLVVMLL